MYPTVQVVGEVDEVVKTGKWVGDCFIYTNSVNRLNYYVGGEIVTISHLDRLENCCQTLSQLSYNNYITYVCIVNMERFAGLSFHIFAVF